MNPFFAFVVHAGGLTFDLTNAANGFTGNTVAGPCKNSQDAAGLFHGLTGPGCTPAWFYGPGSHTDLALFVCATTSNCDDGSVEEVLAAPGTGGTSGGTLTTTQAAATPEPGALWLSGAGLLALMGRLRAQRGRRR